MRANYSVATTLFCFLLKSLRDVKQSKKSRNSTPPVE